MTPGVRLAARLAFSRDPRQRWRQLSVIGSALAAVLALALAAGVWHAALRVEDRLRLRTPLWSDDVAAAPLRGAFMGFMEGSQQVSILWVEPAPGHEADPRIVPPGLSALPPPGSAVVSAGLAERGITPEALGFADARTGTGPDGRIGVEGLGAASEPLVYARAVAGRPLGDPGQLLWFAGYPESLAQAPPGGELAGFASDYPMVEPGRVPVLVVTFYVLPAVLVLLLGARARSPLRTARAETLLRLGVRRRSVRWMLAVEGGALAAVGAALGCAVALVVLPRLTALPATRTTLVPGDLAAPSAAVGLIALGVVASASASAAAGRLVASRRNRPPRAPGLWRVLPVAFGLSATFSGRLVADATPLYLLGVVLVAAGVPLLVPLLGSWLAVALQRVRTPDVWLAARRFVAAPTHLARPAAALGLLVFLSAAAFSAYATSFGAGAGARGPQVYLASWTGARPHDAPTLQAGWARLDGVAVLEVDRDGGGAVLRAHGCAALAPAERWLGPACDGDHVRPQFAQAVSQQLHQRVVIGLDAATHAATHGATTRAANELVVIDAVGHPEAEFYRAGGARLPAFLLTGSSTAGVSQTLGYWVMGGWLVAAALLLLAVLRELGDRLLAGAVEERALLRIGLRDREVDRVGRWTVAIGFLASIPAAYVLGLLVSQRGEGLDVTRFLPSWITGLMLVVAALAGLTAAVLSPMRRSWRAWDAR